MREGRRNCPVRRPKARPLRARVEVPFRETVTMTVGLLGGRGST